MVKSSDIIDVSEFQKEIDWSKVKGNVSGAIIRSGLRGSLAKTNPTYYKKLREDFYFRKNLAGVKKNNIPYSVYFFPTAINDAEALEDAAFFYDQIKGLDLAFPPALDSENVWGKNGEPGRANSLSTETRTRILKIILDYLWERGIKCGIYASAWWLDHKINMDEFTTEQKACTWVADSTGEVDYKGDYWLHQFGKTSCPGVNGDVDVNRICKPVPINKVPESVEPPAFVLDPVEVLIEIMRAEVGYHEKASGSSLDSKKGNSGSRNYTKYGKELHELQPSNMDYPAAWCDAFYDWCILQLCKHFGYGAETARAVLCGTFDDYTYNSVAMYKKAGRWTNTPAPGYQIFFGGSGHTGGVTAVEGNRVYTIEGNKSDEVRECSYTLNDSRIIGYGMPRFDLLGKVEDKAPETVDDLHTVKWSGFAKVDTKVYTQPDTTSKTCSFSPVSKDSELGVCKRVGKFYLCKYKDKYGYIHISHVRK